MNKKTKIIILVSVLILLALGFWYKASKKESEEVSTTDQAICFAKFGTLNNQGFYDKYTLKITAYNEKVTGELKFLPAEKDAKLGAFNGTVTMVEGMLAPQKVNAIWDVFAEGVLNQEELSILFDEDKAYVGFGEMVKRADGIYWYKSSSDISYSLELAKINCKDVYEREIVDNYIRLNIEYLSPVKATLGGKWQVVSDFVNMEKNEGSVVYEDGHNQEKRDFTYVLDDAGQVISLSIK